MKTKKTKVYIVGAGPGDPELITVKGKKILSRANCVLYDFLSNSKLLNYTKESCENICVGKKDGLHLKEQDEINELLYRKARTKKLVVRLKGGDPFVFSRGFEEAKYLRNRGVAVEIIPGITSAIAGPESFGIPLTVKGKIQSLGIVTGRKKDPNAKIDAPGCDTLVYLMAVNNIKNVVKSLKRNGRTGKTPCAFIERGTHIDSRIIKADLDSIAAAAKESQVVAPSVFIVGDVVNHVEK